MRGSRHASEFSAMFPQVCFEFRKVFSGLCDSVDSVAIPPTPDSVTGIRDVFAERWIRVRESVRIPFRPDAAPDRQSRFRRFRPWTVLPGRRPYSRTRRRAPRGPRRRGRRRPPDARSPARPGDRLPGPVSSTPTAAPPPSGRGTPDASRADRRRAAPRAAPPPRAGANAPLPAASGPALPRPGRRTARAPGPYRGRRRARAPADGGSAAYGHAGSIARRPGAAGDWLVIPPSTTSSWPVR